MSRFNNLTFVPFVAAGLAINVLVFSACASHVRTRGNVVQPPTDYSRLGGTGENVGPLVEYPAPSADGQLIAFASNAGQTNTFDIWVADRFGGNSRVLTLWEDSVERSPDWSPDGLRIVFSSD